MVSGVDIPTAQNPLIEASTNVGLINQARQGAIANSSQLVVGKQFQAEVVATLTDGTYIVKVADVAARMQLPNSPDVGSKLSLTLLSTSPRATFLLNPPGEEDTSATPTTTMATLGNSVKQLVDDFNASAGQAGTNKTGAGGLYLQPGAAVTATTNTSTAPRLIVVPADQPDSAPATLSSAGKLVNQLIQNTPQQGSIVNVSRVPLLTTPDVSVNTMMKGLQSGVTNSGMFYESHVLQWAEGTLPATELMKEPQAKFPLPAPAGPATQTTGNTQSALAPSPAEAAKSALGPNSATSTTATTASEATITLPRGATPLIQQQLQTLEQQRFVWHGEVWPGQTMDWEIGQDADQSSGGNPQEKTWQSAVHFELPQLGSISAQLQLTGTHLKLHISTSDATSALMLKNHIPDLASALDLAGTQLDAVTVNTKAGS